MSKLVNLVPRSTFTTVELTIRSKGREVTIYEHTKLPLREYAKRRGAYIDFSNVDIARHPEWTKITLYPSGPFKASENRVVIKAYRTIKTKYGS